MKTRIKKQSFILAIAIIFLYSCFSYGSLLSDIVDEDEETSQTKSNASGSEEKDQEEDDQKKTDKNEDADKKDEAVGISVSVEPEGSDIYIDGKFIGSSPIIVDDLSKGNYAILAKMEGYESEQVYIYYDGENPVQLELKLEQITGSIYAEVFPSNAKLSVSGSLLVPGTSSVLPVGDYLLKAELFGYESVEMDINILENQTSIYKIELKPARFEIVSFGSSKKRFNPNSSSKLGETDINIEASAPGLSTIKISGPGGIIVKEYKDIVLSSELTTVLWNGRNENGQILPDGAYEIEASATGKLDGITDSDESGVILDSTYVLNIRNLWSGNSGGLFAPFSDTLPRDAMHIYVMFMGAFYEQILVPVQAGVRFSPARNMEIGITGSIALSSGDNSYSFAVAYKAGLLNGDGLNLAAAAKLTYAGPSTKDIMANYTGLSAGPIIGAKIGGFQISAAPEIVFSYTHPDMNTAPPPDFYVYAYLRGGMVLDLNNFNLALSSAFRLKPFNQGLAFDMPAHAGIEINLLIPSAQMTISGLGSITFGDSGFFTSFGAGIGLIN